MLDGGEEENSRPAKSPSMIWSLASPVRRPQAEPFGQTISSLSRAVSMSPVLLHAFTAYRQTKPSRAASLLAAPTYRTRFGWRRAAQECRKQTGSRRVSVLDCGTRRPPWVSRRGDSGALGSLP